MVVGSSTWSLLLAPTGKVDAWLRVTRVADDEAPQRDAVAADVIPRFRPDTPVRVTWRPEDVWVVPEDGGSPSNHRPRPGERVVATPT